jgi:hypothetical protein
VLLWTLQMLTQVVFYRFEVFYAWWTRKWGSRPLNELFQEKGWNAGKSNEKTWPKSLLFSSLIPVGPSGLASRESQTILSDENYIISEGLPRHLKSYSPLSWSFTLLRFLFAFWPFLRLLFGFLLCILAFFPLLTAFSRLVSAGSPFSFGSLLSGG